MIETLPTRTQLVAAYREIGRGMNEFMPASEHRAHARARAKLQGEIDAIDAAAQQGRDASAEERRAAALARLDEVE